MSVVSVFTLFCTDCILVMSLTKKSDLVIVPVSLSDIFLARNHLLSEAIKFSLSNGSNRVWVHTCSLDHKNALQNYQARGMEIFKSEIARISI